MLYNLLKYSTLALGFFLLASGLVKARFEVNTEMPVADSTELVKQYETVKADSLPESKEHMIHTSYLTQP